MKISLPAATTVELGRFESDPIETDFGSVHVTALGLFCEAPWGACRILRPQSAIVHYSDGRVVRAVVGDITGRATLALVLAGIIVAWVACHFSQKGLSDDARGGPGH